MKVGRGMRKQIQVYRSVVRRQNIVSTLISFIVDPIEQVRQRSKYKICLYFRWQRCKTYRGLALGFTIFFK